ncbi:Transcriptional regulator containing PAS, AAA-type ATPase, and DNA-binding Fis domains [Anaerobranca californiensis DSM 14826]|uniref:Transcriptional regulator containing PAS, AAA-type ATPase, and DNA-binding Fis domains n=1 Tax=Anaerobranca californiensis DSM 14826 TaxID=1120989 RepID=A0A1M6L1R7_9FIRM|nr:Transcriptional regulator containing PAS, AAA-type ATPase, and DNA-binding Fis domains [Anaerobranca californiensis DSM 14826]
MVKRMGVSIDDLSNKKTIILVTGTEQTKIALTHQLNEYLGDVVNIQGFAIDEGIEEMIDGEIILLSSEIVKEELINLKLLREEKEVIVAQRTIDYDCIDELVLIPEGIDVLFVNDAKESTYDGIEILKKLGFDYVNFIPYYPGLSYVNKKKIDIAITPGERDKVPSFIKKVVDIGPRIMDITTIIHIINTLKLDCYKGRLLTENYLQKIIKMAKRLSQYTNKISSLNNHLHLILDGLHDGLLVYDQGGFITVYNENVKKLIGTYFGDIKGKKITKVIYNKESLNFLLDKRVNNEKIFSLDGNNIIVNKIFLENINCSIAVFKSVTEALKINNKIKLELMKKGHLAKYSFSDIIGSSDKIVKVKEIAKKLAITDLTILIEGESGTGKELFASAIHQFSKRNKGPFLAVNFSALPDELIESELFGYEEGAFTGAKKGGKPGIFEEADGGTIFLDEIGDISLKMQARLLRVLQEKEVMRIGGHQIKTVDVRIIGATNKNLAQLVKEKKFREDLYYRIKMGYIRIPPLRERKEDLRDLINHLVKIEAGKNINVEKGVIEELLAYDWYGNVREPRNVLSYMLAVREGDVLTIKDIPDYGFFIKNLEGKTLYNCTLNLNNELIFLLKKIYELNENNIIVGREKLADVLKESGFSMTPAQIRVRLEKLEKMGLIIKKKGRIGTIITTEGKKLLNTK